MSDERDGRRGGGRGGGGNGGSGSGGAGGKGGAGRRGGGPRRRKVCRYCVDKVDYIDYKDVRLLMMAIGDRGKIQPRRISGTCAKHQRKLTTAIKRGRQIALVPYVLD
jgi:small subunit ribosomal protein S18